MNELKQEKIRRFINDPVMAEAVFEVIRHSFLRTKGPKDVQVLAAERLALDFIDVAWVELERYLVKKEGVAVERQVGLWYN